jgi:hypothetical protein
MNQDIAHGKICPYDGSATKCLDSKSQYHGRSYGPIWVCPKCGAYVGCHKGTTKALGRLADKRLRAAKISAHAAFDMIWKSKKMKRPEAYAWLALKLELPVSETHIGMMDLEQCELTAQYSTAYLLGRVN